MEGFGKKIAKFGRLAFAAGALNAAEPAARHMATEATGIEMTHAAEAQTNSDDKTTLNRARSIFETINSKFAGDAAKQDVVSEARMYMFMIHYSLATPESRKQIKGLASVSFRGSHYDAFKEHVAIMDENQYKDVIDHAVKLHMSALEKIAADQGITIQ